MNTRNLFGHLGGSAFGTATSGNSGIGGTLGNLASSIPGGLAGGAAAGGLMALLVSNKKARKFAGKAATVGGAAVLGGLAFKAFQNYQAGNGGSGQAAGVAPGVSPTHEAGAGPSAASFTAAAAGGTAPGFEWTLIKAMVAAAKADGHLDADEQRKIFKAVGEMNLNTEAKGALFDLMAGDVSVDDLIQDVQTVEQSSELYLASRLAIDPDHPAEETYLSTLAARLGLPEEFRRQLDEQASQL